jgi:hypothetical protein
MNCRERPPWRSMEAAISLRSYIFLFHFVFLSTLFTAGCGLIPVPYATEVTGPVRGIRVLDAGTGADIPQARATVEREMGMTNWVGARPPQLMILAPDSAESRNNLALPSLTRRDDQAFNVPRHVLVGLMGMGYARKNPPTAVVSVWAPDYPHAVLQYCVGHAPETGWTESRMMAGELGPANQPTLDSTPPVNTELVRCEFQQDGILRFYLRRLPPEMTEAIHAPGQGIPSNRGDSPVFADPIFSDRASMMPAEIGPLPYPPPERPVVVNPGDLDYHR